MITQSVEESKTIVNKVAKAFNLSILFKEDIVKDLQALYDNATSETRATIIIIALALKIKIREKPFSDQKFYN